MDIKTTILPAVLFCGISACSNEPPSAPSCRVDSRYEENISGTGACIIRLNDKLVTISLKGDRRYSLPFVSAIVNNNAQCDAHANTWNLTGFNVQVGRFLNTTTSNRRLYECTLKEEFPIDFTEFGVPSFVDRNVESIQLISPFDITPRQWVDGDELIKIRFFFNQINL